MSLALRQGFFALLKLTSLNLYDTLDLAKQIDRDQPVLCIETAAEEVPGRGNDYPQKVEMFSTFWEIFWVIEEVIYTSGFSSSDEDFRKTP
ncbi:MAG TPA: hypothetical protein VLZ10_04590 [Thermodesulfobacteriota bacterium]|nr:hypothetical protein [Thermodesulfobacteriota bacterium]